jgi:hypothetical protein
MRRLPITPPVARGALAAALGIALLSGAVLGPVAARADVTRDDFYVRKAQDLVDLCSVKPDDPLYGRAIEFCEGFASGAWQYHQAQAAGPEGHPIVCMPDPPPTRNEAIAGFVEWAGRHPEFMKDAAVEAMFRYLTEKWPCTGKSAGQGGKAR